MLFGSASGMITIQGSQALNTARNITRALTDMGRVKPNVSMKSTINDLRQAGREAATAGSRTQGLGRHIRALAGTRVAGILTPIESEARSAEAAVDDLAQSVDQMALGLILAGGASAALGKPLMAATIGSIKNAASLEQAIQNINAALGGLDASTLAELSDHMIQVGIDSEYSAQEVAGVGEALAKAGYDTEQIMGGMTEAVIHLASATGTNLEPATRGIIQALSIWAPGMVDASIAMTDAARAADILTIAANESQADVEEIIQGMRALGPVAGQLGIGFDEAAAAIAIFTNYGMKGADAGLSLARGLENLSTPTSEAAQRMEELGIAAFDAQGDFVGFPSLFRQLSTAMKDMDDQTKLATLSMIFGQEAADVMALAIASGADPLEAMIALMDEQGVAANQAALRMDTLSGAWQQFTEGIQSASGAMMRGALEPLKNLFEFLSDMLGRIAQLPQPILNFMGALLALTSTLLMVNAAVLIGRGVWARWGDELLNGERAAKAMSGSVGGLRSAFVALWRSFGVGVFSLIPSLSTVMLYFSGLAAVIIGMGAVIGAFRADFLGIRTAFEGVQNFIDNFREGWNKFKDDVSSAASALGDVKDAVETVTDPIDHAKNTLDGIARTMNNVSDAAEGITTGIGRVSLFFMALAYAIRLINDGDIPGWAQDLADSFEEIAPIAQQVVDILQAASDVDLSNLEDIKEAIEDLPAPIQNLVRGVSGIITSFSVLGRAFARGGLRSFITQLPYELTLMGRAFGDVFRGISDVIRATTGNLGRIGDIMRPIANMFDELGDAATSLGRGLSWMMLGEFELALADLSNALDSLGRAFGDLGDVFTVFGDWMDELGVKFPALKRVTDELRNTFDDLSDVFDSLGSALQNFADGDYEQAFNDLGSAVASLLSAGIDYAQALFWGLVAAIEALDWDAIIQGIEDFADGLGEVPYIGWLLEAALDAVAWSIEGIRNAVVFLKDHWDDITDAFDRMRSIAETLGDKLGPVKDQLDSLPQPLKDIATHARNAYIAMLLLQGVMLIGGGGAAGKGGKGGWIGALLNGLLSIALFPVKLLLRPFKILLAPITFLLKPIAALIRGVGGLAGAFNFLLAPFRLVASLIKGLGSGIASFVGLFSKGFGGLVKIVGNFVSTFGKGIMNIIGIVGKVGKGIGSFASTFGRGFANIIRWSGQLIGVFGRLGPMITRLATGGFGVLATLARLAAGGLAALGPLGWAVLAVIAAVGLAIAAYRNNWLGFRDAVGWVVDRLQEFIDIAQLVIGWAWGKLSAAWDTIAGGIQRAYEWARDLWDLIQQIFGAPGEFVVRGLEWLQGWSWPDWDWSWPEFNWSWPEFNWSWPSFSWEWPEFSWSWPEFSWEWPEFSWSWPEFSWSWPEFEWSWPEFNWSWPDWEWGELPTWEWPEFSWSWPEFNWSWPEFSWDWPEFSWTWPEFSWTWPEFSWSWPDFEWSWPEFVWDWPSLPNWSWPSLPTWEWPSLPKWEWPSIPMPDWMPGWLGGGGDKGTTVHEGSEDVQPGYVPPAQAPPNWSDWENLVPSDNKPMPGGFASPDQQTLAMLALYNDRLAEVKTQQSLYQQILARYGQVQGTANQQMSAAPLVPVSTGWQRIAQSIAPVQTGVQKVGTWFTQLPSVVQQPVQQTAAGVTTGFQQMAGNAVYQAGLMNTGVVTAQSGMAGNVISNVGRMAIGALGGFTSMQSGGTTQTATLAGNALGSSSSMAGGVVGAILGMTGSALTGFGSMQSGGSSEASRLDKNASGSAKGMGSTVGSAVSSMASLAMSRFGNMQSTGTSESSRMKGNVSNNSSSMAQAVGNAMQQVVRNVSSGMSDASRAISREAGTWSGYIRSAGGSAAGAATGVGVAIGQGLVNGMASMRGAVAATAASLAAAAASAIAVAAAVRSPSKITIAIGKDIARGLPVGMTHRDSIHRVVSGAKDIVGRLMSGIQASPGLTWGDILGTSSLTSGFGVFPALANGVHYSGLMQGRYIPPTQGDSMQHRGTYAGESMAYQRPPTQTNITNIYALRAEELTELIEKSQRGADHADAWEQPQALSQYVRVARS